MMQRVTERNKAFFPGIMTVVSLLAALAAYIIVIRYPIEPYFKEGLLFFLAPACFGILTLLALAQPMLSMVLTVAALLLWMPLSLFLLFGLGMDASTTVTTDVSYYQRVLDHVGHPTNPLARQFPDEVPEAAQNPQLHYHSAIAQGGELLALQYQAGHDELEDYQADLAQKALWSGSPNDQEAQAWGVHPSLLSVFEGEAPLSGDVTVFVLYSKPYRANDWNHGAVSLAALSKEQGAVLFVFEQW